MSILGLSVDPDPTPLATPDPIRQRLADAFALVTQIEQQRLQGQDPPFGRFMEERLVWRELLDLELQEIDEQIERVRASAAVARKAARR